MDKLIRSYKNENKEKLKKLLSSKVVDLQEYKKLKKMEKIENEMQSDFMGALELEEISFVEIDSPNDLTIDELTEAEENLIKDIMKKDLF